MALFDDQMEGLFASNPHLSEEEDPIDYRDMAYREEEDVQKCYGCDGETGLNSHDGDYWCYHCLHEHYDDFAAGNVRCSSCRASGGR